MNFTPEEVRRWKGVALTHDELDALLESRPSRLLPIIAEEAADHFADAGKKIGRPRSKVVNDLGQNKGEARLDAYLAGLKTHRLINDFRFEPFNLRLPGRVWFRLDFVVRRLDHSLILIDYKGGWTEEDARIKLKTCSESFAWLGQTYVCRYVNREHLFFPVRDGRISDVPDLLWMRAK